MIWSWRRCLLHVPIGVVLSLLVLVHWILPLCFLLLFMEYERNEDGHLDDKAFKDIQGAIAGLPAGAALAWLIGVWL